MKRALFVLLFISALFNWSKAQYFDPNYQDKYKPSGKDSLDAIKKQQEAANPKKEEPKKDYRHKQESPDFFNKLVPGCNFSLSFGSPTMINVSPMLGYKVTSRLIPGVGATYIYYNYGGIAANFYGGRIFTRYIIKRIIFSMPK